MKKLKSVITVILVVIMLPVSSLAQTVQMGQIVYPAPVNMPESEDINLYNETETSTSDADSSSDINNTRSETGFDLMFFDRLYQETGIDALDENGGVLFVNGTGIPIRITKKGNITANVFGDSEDEVYEFEQDVFMKGETLEDLLDSDSYSTGFVKKTMEDVFNEYYDILEDILNGQKALEDYDETALGVLYSILNKNHQEKKNMQDELSRAVAAMFDRFLTWGDQLSISVQAVRDEEVRRRWLALRAQMIQEAEEANEAIDLLAANAVTNAQVVNNPYLIDVMSSGDAPVQLGYKERNVAVKMTLVNDENMFNVAEHNIYYVGNGSGKTFDVETFAPENQDAFAVAYYIQGAVLNNIADFSLHHRYSAWASDEQNDGRFDNLTDPAKKPTVKTVTWDEWNNMTIAEKAACPEDIRTQFYRFDMIDGLLKIRSGEVEVSEQREKIAEMYGEDAAELFGSPTGMTELSTNEELILELNKDVVTALESGNVPDALSYEDSFAEGEFGLQMADLVDQSIMGNVVVNTSDNAPRGEAGTEGELPNMQLCGDFGNLSLIGYYDRDAFVRKMNERRYEWTMKGKTFDLDPNNPDREEIDETISRDLIECTPQKVSRTDDAAILTQMGFDTSGLVTAQAEIPYNGYTYNYIPQLEADINAMSKTQKTPEEINAILSEKYHLYDKDMNPIDFSPALAAAKSGQKYHLTVSANTAGKTEGYKYEYKAVDVGSYVADISPGMDNTDDAMDDLITAMQEVAEANNIEIDASEVRSVNLPNEECAEIFDGMIYELTKAVREGRDTASIVKKYDSKFKNANNGEAIDLSAIGDMFTSVSTIMENHLAGSDMLEQQMDEFEKRTSGNPIQSVSQDNLSNYAVNVEGLIQLAYGGDSSEKNDIEKDIPWAVYDPTGIIQFASESEKSTKAREAFWQDEEAVAYVFDSNGDGSVTRDEIRTADRLFGKSLNTDIYEIVASQDPSKHDAWFEHMENGFVWNTNGAAYLLSGQGELPGSAVLRIKSPNASDDYIITDTDAVSSASYIGSYEYDGWANISIEELAPTHNQGHFGNAVAMDETGATMISTRDANVFTLKVRNKNEYHRVENGTNGQYWFYDSNGSKMYLSDDDVDRLARVLEGKIAKRFGRSEEEAEGLIKIHMVPIGSGATFCYTIDMYKLVNLVTPQMPSRDKLREVLGLEVVNVGTLIRDNIEMPTFSVVIKEDITDADMKDRLNELYETYIKNGSVSDDEYMSLCPLLDLALDLYGTPEEKEAHEARINGYEESTGKKVTREDYYEKKKQEAEQEGDTGENDDTNKTGEEDGDPGSDDSSVDGKKYIRTQQDLIDYLISIGIDPETIPEEITIEWLKENVDPQKYTTFYADIEFKATRYTRVQRSDMRIEETNSYYRTGSSYRYAITCDGNSGGRGSASENGIALCIGSKITTVDWSATARRKYSTAVYYTMLDTLRIDALDCVLYSKTVQGDGENGLVYREERLSAEVEVPLNTNVYEVVEEEDEEDIDGDENDETGRVFQKEDTTTIVRKITTITNGSEGGNAIVINIINLFTTMGGKWVNGIKNLESIGWLEMQINKYYNINESHTYRVN